jgi:hypothetical protein
LRKCRLIVTTILTVVMEKPIAMPAWHVARVYRTAGQVRVMRTRTTNRFIAKPVMNP